MVLSGSVNFLFLIKLLSLKPLCSGTLCLLAWMPSLPLLKLSTLWACSPKTGQGLPAVCILLSLRLFSDNRHQAAATTCPTWMTSSPPSGLDTIGQTVFWCTCLSHCAPALPFYAQLSPQGCLSCFAWALRPWARPPASMNALTLLRLWCSPLWSPLLSLLLAHWYPMLSPSHVDAFLSLFMLWHPLLLR